MPVVAAAAIDGVLGGADDRQETSDGERMDVELVVPSVLLTMVLAKTTMLVANASTTMSTISLPPSQLQISHAAAVAGGGDGTAAAPDFRDTA
jgi:hypothetical protein